jgi:hypothetical protein
MVGLLDGLATLEGYVPKRDSNRCDDTGPNSRLETENQGGPRLRIGQTMRTESVEEVEEGAGVS